MTTFLDTAEGFNRRAAPVVGNYFDTAQRGFDVGTRVNQAQADVEGGYKNTLGQLRREASRMGLNPNSANFTRALGNAEFRKAGDIAGARTNARNRTEEANVAMLHDATKLALPHSRGLIETETEAATAQAQLDAAMERLLVELEAKKELLGMEIAGNSALAEQKFGYETALNKMGYDNWYDRYDYVESQKPNAAESLLGSFVSDPKATTTAIKDIWSVGTDIWNGLKSLDWGDLFSTTPET